MVLVILAAIWAAVLLPPWLQNRRSFHPTSSVVDFRQQLATLERSFNPSHRATGRALGPRSGMSRSESQRRRRDVLTTLALAAGLTFALALALGGTVWLLNLAVDGLLLGYVAMLMQMQQQRVAAIQAQQRAKVRYLPTHRNVVSPQAALLRRQAN